MVKSAKVRKDYPTVIYDGECPFCTHAAMTIRLNKSYGGLNLVNARDMHEHPLLQACIKRQIDLNEGVVFIIGTAFYSGVDAVHQIAIASGRYEGLNRMMAAVMRRRGLARLIYPILKFLRNSLLYVRGKSQIKSAQQTTRSQHHFGQFLFGKDWPALPQVLRDHYDIYLGSDDRIKVKGHLDVKVSKPMAFLSVLTKQLVPFSGDQIPVTVCFYGAPSGKALVFDREFNFPNHKPIRFRSQMELREDGSLIEWTSRFLGWHLTYGWDGRKVVLRHLGYKFRLGKWISPLPLTFLIGRGYAEEKALDHEHFHMWTEAKSRLFGRSFYYGGTFQITDRVQERNP